MLFNKKEQMSEKVKTIKELIESGLYNWETAIELTVDKILEYPESLLWQ